jgi:hypothetical protein
VLRPRVFSEFLRQYDGHSFPCGDIALNVLAEKGVPRNKTTEVFTRIQASAELVGFITEIKGKKYATLQGETLDANATIKLLEAIKDIKNNALSTDPPPGEA